MRKSGILIVLAVLLALLTGCQSSQTAFRTVTVSGKGSVTLTPDMASFSVSIEETADTTSQAQSGANAKMAEITSILEGQYGILAEDIRTTGMSLYPSYRYQDGEQILIGQTASQSLSVTVHRLDDLAPIVDSLSSVSGISLSSTRRGALQSRTPSPAPRTTPRALACPSSAPSRSRRAAATMRPTASSRPTWPRPSRPRMP